MPPQCAKRKMQYLRPIIGAAGAMLLKARNPQMSAVQYFVGLSLFVGRTRKKVCLKIFPCYVYIIAVVEKIASILPVNRIFETGNLSVPSDSLIMEQ